MPNAVTPLGLLYVMASSPDRHEMELVDLCFEAVAAACLRDRLTAFRPDLVAISMRNIQNNEYSDVSDTLSYYADLIDNVRAVTSAPVVLGGAGFSIMPNELMRHLEPDFGISGEGERAFPEQLAALDSDSQSLHSIGALYHWRGDTLEVNNRPAGYLDQKRLPKPARTVIEPG